MLSTLPPELLSQVAFWLVLETCAPPVPLLCASQALYTALSPASNPNLYASVFRAHYDVDAPTRRLALGTGDWLGENEDLNENEDDEEVGKVGESSAAAAAAAASSIAAGKLRSRQLTDELRTRTRALTRLAAAAEHSPEAIEAEDLWIVYMMLIENGALPISCHSPSAVLTLR
jgi:hypothetical protein